MPPKRRSPPGCNRIDAALDALRPMGFTDAVIRRNVRALLKVYGNEGWRFIEEFSYKLLIETILEEQTKGSDETDGSTLVCLPECSKNEKSESKFIVEVEAPHVHHTEISSSHPEQSLPSSSKDGSSCGWIEAENNPLAITAPPAQRRRPCYGWISDDEE